MTFVLVVHFIRVHIPPPPGWIKCKAGLSRWQKAKSHDRSSLLRWQSNATLSAAFLQNF